MLCLYRENLEVKSHCKLFNAQRVARKCIAKYMHSQVKKTIASAEKVFEHDHKIVYITFEKSDSLFLLLGGV